MTVGTALVAVALMVVLNGLYVAVEFSFVGLRRTDIDEAARAGDRRAARVVEGLERLSFLLSIVQFGITATSLVVGIVAGRLLGEALFAPALVAIGIAAEPAATLGVTVAIVVSTVVQMVLGELLPKTIAIARPSEVATRLAPFALLSMRLLGPVVAGFDVAARWVTRALFRVETAEHLDGARTLDEVARIIAVSGAQGRLTERQADLLRRAAALGDRRVDEVMVARPDVVWLAADDDLGALRDASARTGHSRFPVRRASEDDVVGSVHVKDLLRADHGRGVEHGPGRTLGALARPVIVVPEHESLRVVLRAFQGRRRTFALVVDEYGSTAGIVTVEDVLEALVGDISDEHDTQRLARALGDGRRVVAASLGLARFEELFDVALPEGPYETVAGFVLERLGIIPDVGARVHHEGLVLEVAAVEGLRVTEVIVGPVPEVLGRVPGRVEGGGEGETGAALAPGRRRAEGDEGAAGAAEPLGDGPAPRRQRP